VALLTGERAGYYGAYGERSHLARALRDGFVYTGQYSPYRRRRHGRPPFGDLRDRLVVFAQNHDQVGNRRSGERLEARAGFEAAKLAAAVVLLSPFVPLLFMGEEHADPAPFLYFTSHGDPGLVQAVRDGRRREFEAFHWQGEPPDPQAESTFAASRLDWGVRSRGRHRDMLAWYRALIALRRGHPALAGGGRVEVELPASAGLLQLRRRRDSEEAWVVANLDREPRAQRLLHQGEPWRRVLDSCEPRFGGLEASAPAEIGARAPALGQPRAAAADAARISVRLPPHGVAVYLRGHR
jgi:maltooligosyltrehalose trehalohydrolase